jgi:hypothetical protein
MDILEKIELFLGEEISGTPAGAGTGGTAGTGVTTTDVAKYSKRSNIINRNKKKADDDDSEQQANDKRKQVKSGSHALSGTAVPYS